MSVVGIDFGLDTCYISVARQGGIETIANDYSMRDSPSFVSFADNQRILAVGAKNQMLTNLKRTFFDFKLFLGKKFNDPLVQKSISQLPYPISKGPDDSIQIHVDFAGKDQTFSPEQITAMLFTKLKFTADEALSTKVKDVVISVPVYFTDSERRSLLDAAAIAGLNVLKLMNDTTATALAYGIYKQDLPSPEEKARNVIFVDCGHRGIQVAACSFHKGKLVIQACAFNCESGGKRFNEVLAQYCNKQFMSSFKIDARTNKKAMLKLITELEKIKKQMSVNTNKMPLSIECFMDDKDVRATVDRATFEGLIESELKAIEETLRSCLSYSKWKVEDIYSVEVVGGSTRIPAIKNIIEKVYGKTPNTTLNADEAVSRGCALQCAILSPTFRVREFSVTDVQPYPIKLRWQAESDSGDMIVFPQFHAVPFSKLLTFYRRDSFELVGEYDKSAIVNNPKIGVFEIGELKPMEDGSNQKVKVKVRINMNGIFTVASASFVEKQEIEEEVPMEVDVPKESSNQGATNANDKDTVGKNGDAMEADVPVKQPVKMEKRKRTVQKNIELPITIRAFGSLSYDQLQHAIALEKSLVTADLNESERINAKNAVEEYIYDIRSKIIDELADYVTEELVTMFSDLLGNTEEWLYGEGENCEKNVYVEKLKIIQSIGEPIKKRRIEFEGRQRAIETLVQSINNAEKVLTAYRAGDERYNHLNPDDMDKVANLITEKQQWIQDCSAQLSALVKTDDPPIVLTQIYSERQGFEAIVNPIITRNKPKPPPPPPKEEDAKKDVENSVPPTTDDDTNSKGVDDEGNMDLD